MTDLRESGQQLLFEDETPNAETRAAMDELEAGGGKRISTIEEMLAELNADD